MSRTIADAALEKQATDVVILDLRELDAITDCFVICSGSVNQQVRAIADNIEKKVKERTDDRLLHREGMDTLNWVILDYVNVVVHVFRPTFREFYRLENLWGDAKAIAVKDKVASRRTKPATARVSVVKRVIKPRIVKTAAKKLAEKKSTAPRRKADSRPSKKSS